MIPHLSIRLTCKDLTSWNHSLITTLLPCSLCNLLMMSLKPCDPLKTSFF